jgi:hypothetical protein
MIPREEVANREFLKSMARAGEGVQSVVRAVGLSDTGITCECLLRLFERSSTLQLLPKSAAARIPDMVTLPPGHDVYFGIAGTWYSQVLSRLRQDESERILDPKPELAKAEAELDNIEIRSRIGSLKFDKLGQTSDEALVLEANQPQSYRDLQRQIARLKNGADTPAFRWAIDQATS